MDFLVYDITKIREAEKIEFNLKSKFFAKITHEFKTPLNSIIGLIKNLNKLLFAQKKNFNNKEINFTLKQIENLSNYVILLINDIIQSSYIYSSSNSKRNDNNNNNHNENYNEKSNCGVLASAKNKSDSNLIKKLNLKIEEIDLKEITKFCKEVLQTLLISKEKQNHVRIKYCFDPRILNYKLLSDEFRLKQILLNLISNSVKFTKSGSITIKSQLDENTNEKSQQQFVKISIIDTGIGLQDQELKILLKFKETNLFEGARNFNQEGSGLGMGITKYLADELGHTLEIESCFSKGSCFSLVVKAEAKANEPENAKANSIFYNELKIEKDFFDCENNKNENENKNKLSRKEYEKQIIIFDKEKDDGFSGEENSASLNNNKNYYNENDGNEEKENSSLFSNFEKKIKIIKDKKKEENNKNLKRKFSSCIKNENHKTYANSYKQENYLGKKTEEELLFYIKTTKEVTKSEKLSSRNVKTFSMPSKFKKILNCNYKTIWDNESFETRKNQDLNFIFFKNCRNHFEKTRTLSNELLDNSTEKHSIVFENPYKFKNLNIEERETIKIKKKKDFAQNKRNSNGISKNDKFNAGSRISLDLKNITSKLIGEYSSEKRIDFIDFSNLYVKDSFCLSSVEHKKKAENKNNHKQLKDSENENENENQNQNIFSSSKATNKNIKNVILLVDDHIYVRESVRNIINTIIKKQGLLHKFTIKEEKDGSDIIKDIINDQFENNRICCVITDENMEFINGSEAIKIIKNLEKNKKIKPIAIASITAYEDEMTRNYIKNSGVDYFIPKPCTEKSVLDFFREFNILGKKD